MNQMLDKKPAAGHGGEADMAETMRTAVPETGAVLGRELLSTSGHGSVSPRGFREYH